jgi:group I intron endonuclease
MEYTYSLVRKNKMICGIYQIKQISTGKIYIGSSVNVYKRLLEHRRDLKNQTHDNRHLQRAWNLCGSKDFEFLLLEESNINNYRQLEQEYIDKLQCFNREIGFNMCQNVERGPLGLKRSEETKQRLSEALSGKNHPNWGKPANMIAHKKAMDKVRGKPKPNAGKRKIFKLLSPNGIVIEFDGIRRFCRQYNLSSGNITSLLKGRLKSAKGWSLPNL